MDSFLQQYWWGVILAVIWELVWRGWALWRACQRGEKAWFVVLLIVNTFGLLPIMYLYVFSKKKP